MPNSPKKKITLLINTLHGGGTQRVCVTLANGFKAYGWDVDLVVLNLENAVLAFQISKGIKITDLNVRHARTSFYKLTNYLKNNKPRKILVFNPQLAILLFSLRKLIGSDFKIITRNTNTLTKKRAIQISFWHRHIVDYLIRYFYKRVDKVIAQSYGMKKDLIAHYGLTEDKVSVINNPIRSVFIDYSTDRIKSNFFLCIGRLETQKAFHFVIEAFASIVDHIPKMRLKILGEGSLKEELQLLAKKYGVDDRIDFEGFQEDTVSYYKRAKATILTSLYEGFPNVLIESIALGTPVIAFDCQSGPREIIIENENGYLIKYQNVEHLKSAMLKALEPGAFDSNVVKETAEKYKLDEILKQYEKVINAL